MLVLLQSVRSQLLELQQYLKRPDRSRCRTTVDPKPCNHSRRKDAGNLDLDELLMGGRRSAICFSRALICVSDLECRYPVQ